MNSTTNTMFTLNCHEHLKSMIFYDNTRKINIYVTIAIIVVGLIGNSLAVFVFAQKKFRLHSSSIYLLCLCSCDGLFLLMHFFEDTLRTYIDVYYGDLTRSLHPDCLQILAKSPILQRNVTSLAKSNDSFLKLLNITDRFDISCRLVNYLRYFLRFISAYIIIAFTIQRTFAIYSPFFQAKFESNKHAWYIVVLLGIIGFVLNIWVPFLFNLIDDSQMYCDIRKDYSSAYFLLTIFYIALTMLIPILVIFICNFLIIFYVIRAGREREKMINQKITNKRKQFDVIYQPDEAKALTTRLSELSPIDSRNVSHSYSVSSQSDNASGKRSINLGLLQLKNANQNNNRKQESNKITRMLLLMSFSYAVLNIPYFISWCLFFYQMGIQKSNNPVKKYYLFSAINLCEIFYVLNYGVHFFIYCASGQKFRQQLKNALSFRKK